MAKGIYVGVDNKARKVKAMYVGVDGVARKVKKAYIGVESLFYETTTFTKSLAPTSWTDGSDGLSATSSNDYGTWELSATKSPWTTGTSIGVVSDGLDSTTWQFSKLTSNSEVVYIYLKLPSGVTINPDSIYVRHNQCGGTSYPAKVQGYDGSSWIDLCTLTAGATERSETFTILDDSKFFTEFRISIYRYSSSNNTPYISEFQIKSGTIRKNTGETKGLARLFYETATYIPFTSCPYQAADSSWVSVKNYTEYTYTNDYGVWRAKATGTASGTNPAYYAFDTSSSSSWENAKGGDTLAIEFPKGVTINPTQINATGTDNTTVGFAIYGVKADGAYEKLVFYDDDQSFSETFNIATDSYFTKLVFVTGVDGTRNTFVKRFLVQSGTLRVE